MFKDVASAPEALGDALGPCQKEAVRARQADELTAPLHEEIDVLKLELAERDAMLGAVLTALADIDDAMHMCLTSDNQPLKLLRNAMPVWYQAEEGGLSWEGVERWWLDHQTRVRARKEQQARERERRRQEILRRLTAEEREILGI
jgi:hypothetical protein